LNLSRLDLHRGALRRLLGTAAVLAALVAPCTGARAQDAQTLASTVCAACHGIDGNSAIAMFPKIAGLQSSYLAKQLRDFQAGRRKSDVMAPVVATLKPQDIVSLADYYAVQAIQASIDVDAKIVGIGKLIYFDGNEQTGVPACVGCHQPAGAGHLSYPRIGGQHAAYLRQQLKSFANGDRSNDANRFMRVVAKRLSEEEIDAVAAYLASLGAPSGSAGK
jgi:cytochrome c553